MKVSKYISKKVASRQTVTMAVAS